MISPVQTAARAAVRALLSLPSPVLRALAGPPRRRDDGQELDLQIQVLLRGSEVTGMDADANDEALEVGRRRMERGALLVDLFPSIAVQTRDVAVPAPHGTIGARLYTPPRAPARGPLVVYFHGGGWVRGSLRSHDGVCRSLAAHANVRVFAVDYRLAPEHRFPAAVDDALTAFRYVARNGAALGADPSRLAVAGDSAGGNLAAVVALETRGDEVRPSFQLLVYPATDMTRSHPSHQLFAEGFLLTKPAMDWLLDQYQPDPSRYREWRGSPLFVPAAAGAPPAMVITAGFDPLRDEGRAYADKLRDAGVSVEYVCAESMVHGFFSMAGVVREARRVFDRAVDALHRWATASR
jgi:acetyl esterase